MPRIRTVKPDLFRHEALYEAEMRYQLPLRFAFIGLFTCCDREGRFRWRPRQLKLDVLPYDEMDFSIILNALAEVGFIEKYAAQGEEYGYIPSWHRHQVLNNKEKKSDYPVPPSQLNHNTFKIHAHSANYDSVGQVVEESKHKNFPYHSAPSIDMQKKADQFLVETRSSVKYDEEETMRSSQKEKVGQQEVAMNFRESFSAILMPPSNDPCDEKIIQRLFTYWNEMMKQRRTRFDKKDALAIRAALALGYNESELQEAIIGCKKTPFNMGLNTDGKLFNDLSNIFKDEIHIEQFRHNAHSPPKPCFSKLVRSNLKATQRWVSQKMAVEDKNEPIRFASIY